MLMRLEWIKDCGIFVDYHWDTGLQEFARLNVLYGPNGSGKTSLAGALDGLRHSSDNKGFERLSIAHGNSGGTKVTNGADDPLFDRIYVFSEHFVDRNHSLTSDVAEMKSVLTIGERAIETEKELNDLRKKLEDTVAKRDGGVAAERLANQAIEKLYGQVSQQVVDAASKAGGRYHSRSNFNAGMVRTAFEGSHKAWIELPDADFQEKTGLINADKAEPLPEDDLVVNAVDGIAARISSALSATPSTIILDTLAAHPEATSWVSEGRRHHEGVDTCIFCGSPLTEERRGLIDQHFSDEVQKLEKELRDIIAVLADVLSKVGETTQNIPKRGLFFEDLRIRYEVPAKATKDELRALKTWADAAKKRVEAKLANVLSVVDSQVDRPPTVAGSDLIKLRNEHNERVSKHDELVKAAAHAVELHYLKKAEDDVASKVTQARTLKSEASSLSNDVTSLTAKIVALETVGGDPTPSAAVLTTEVARLLGRGELKFEAVGDKYQVTRNGEPAVGLSVGERTAITLVHFLETVARCDTSHGRPIVVIDDPVSSLDSEIFMGVSTYIWNEAVFKDHVAQLFLLTHNFELFRQWDVQLEALHRVGKDKKTGKSMKDVYPAAFYELKSTLVSRLGIVKRSPVIAGWPPSAATRQKVRSTYHHAFIATVDKLENLKTDDSMENRLDAQLLFPNVMRRMLETFLAFKHPEWVGNFTLAMHNSGDLLREAGYQGDSDALRLRLTRYTHANSHSETPATDATVSPDEVRTAIEAVFEFMHLIDPAHFEGLCIVTGVDSSALLPTAAPIAPSIAESPIVAEAVEEI